MAGNISYIYDRKHRLLFTVPSCCHSKTNQVALALSIAIQERWTPPRKTNPSILKKKNKKNTTNQKNHCCLRYLLQITAYLLLIPEGAWRMSFSWTPRE